MMQALPPIDPQPVIIVTGRALPDPAGEGIVHVERLSRGELQAAGTQPLDRLLSRFAGAEQFRRSDSRSAHPTSQGLTLRGLGGNAASRALVILDGVPQADPFGGWIAWPALATAGIGEIRLRRGGGSVTAGPGALGGVLELSSFTEPQTGAVIEGGSRHSAAGEIVAAGRVGDGVLSVTLSGSRSDGFVPVVSGQRGLADRRAPHRNGSARVRWVVPVGADNELQASVLTFSDRRERGLDYTLNRTRGADLSLRMVARGGLPWTALLYAQGREFDSSFAAVDSDRVTARQTSLQYDVPASAIGWSAEARPRLGSELELRVGIDGRRAYGRSLELASYVAGAATRSRDAGGQSSRAGVFAEVTHSAGRLTITGSARIDHWRVFDGRLSERVIATGASVVDRNFETRSGWRPTARAGLAGRVTDGLTLRSAAYVGWREPTLNELFRPFRAGSDVTAANASLRPERLRGIEAGGDLTKGPWRASVTAFVNKLEDAIANVSLGTGPGTFDGVGFVPAGGAYRQRQNVAALSAKGVEASGTWTSGAWSVSTSLSVYDARVSATGAGISLDGLRPAQTPSYSVAVGAGWRKGARSADVRLNYDGGRFEDDLNLQSLPGAVAIDTSASWPLSRKLAVSARIENALNTRIVSAISAAGVEERASPRTFWVGLSFSGSALR